ncbi:MAG: hypothetical protein AB1Z21_03285 [Synechococcaceae cyanobacterium]
MSSRGLRPPFQGVRPESVTRSLAAISPRKQWPAGGLSGYGLRGRIPADRQAEPGKALSFWSDAGWADLVKRGKFVTGQFDDALVQACVQLLEQWRPAPAPEWVTCIPSRRHPDLVPALAARLAAALGLPFLPALQKVRGTAEQKAMENSTQQARNLDGSLAIAEPIPTGPCLLITILVAFLEATAQQFTPFRPPVVMGFSGISRSDGTTTAPRSRAFAMDAFRRVLASWPRPGADMEEATISALVMAAKSGEPHLSDQDAAHGAVRAPGSREDGATTMRPRGVTPR